MNFTEAAAARDRLEAWANNAGTSKLSTWDIGLVCAWTRHWEHACAELDAMLDADRARAQALKTPGGPR